LELKLRMCLSLLPIMLGLRAPSLFSRLTEEFDLIEFSCVIARKVLQNGAVLNSRDYALCAHLCQASLKSR
jgi:hypothetical protein